ncbi:MAG TPA: zf-HC2 domain-containing protein [Gemmataceae bacterium]|nr:zf-HC2 domain-containing protein [Gemmataceae bacterium]
MDCSTARMLVTFFGRQGSELAPEDAADLDAHLASCPKCAELVRFERAFDDRVAKAMLAVPVPTHLKGKLLDGITAQRASWYREKAWALVGLAAGVLLTIGGVIAWQIKTAPELTVEAVVDHQTEIARNPGATIADVLGERGLEFNPERPFDLNQFVGAAMGKLKGRTVPVIYFRNGPKNADATVFVVRDRDFNWKNLPQDGSSAPPSLYGFQVALIRDARRADVAYVVVFTGPGLDAFLESRSSA